MGLFDKFKKKNELLDNEKNEEIEAPGWDAIDKLCDKIYPNQNNPKHYAAMIKWRFGGNDPLDGISVYDGGDYWHFITYGLSELYEKESEDKEWSGYGMELTLKLKKDHYENEDDEIRCICDILQSIARMTFTQGELFNAYEYLYTRQTAGIDSKGTSHITGFITIPDDKFVEINTPNGRVRFAELIGVTYKELLAIQHKELTVKELFEKLNTDVTSYTRASIV